MKRFNVKCGTLLLLLLLFSTMLAPLGAAANAPYPGYNYSYWENTNPSAIPYLPGEILDGIDEEYGRLRSPEDVFVTQDHDIYLLDSGNNRILVFDEGFTFIRSIEEFKNGSEIDQFNHPQGIFVTDDGFIYVADTNNQRVVELTKDGEFIREIGKPESDVIRAGFEYYPVKIAVDQAKRIYVIGRGIYDGIIEFDSDGHFSGFTGANRVTFNPIEYVWRVFATREQRAQMSLFIPIEFNNLALDDEGFIYTTNSERNTNTPIQRLNPTGEDVLRKQGYHDPIGDLEIAHVGHYAGSSTFIDIDVNNYGVYSALDLNRGRVFTYDEDGNLLYVFGQIGEQRGTFRNPVAIARLGEDVLVLDKGFNRITRFEATEFGSLVNQAVMHYHKGNDQESANYWHEVLKLNTNYEVAYVGIGKALLMEGQNREAMVYFENGNSRQYYSKAFKRYRQEVMREHFGTVMTGVFALALFYVVFRTYRRIRRGGERVAAK
ncbi:NHL repeat-containing protein [Halalkalibacter sp. APA_J-10(15)]|uniref:NHL repeat-containing protein n=1 Tax=Halalkalibacter sp. APA_J-10(15) TaxID=2933805 RepID=UPI001FF229FA|nr:NHL repeat-containing protein [Halalkalibacter sp. APA_J-10(15)]MCK0472253.1 NHL repeat-containing protein [Halalkalibacter sp. APA_J-10(15)]